MAKIFVCGDIINMYSSKQFIGIKLQKIITDSDYAIGNFEGCVGEGYQPKNMLQEPNTPILLKDAGFNLMLLANNHIGDYGKHALLRTINILKCHGLNFMGAGMNYEETYEPRIQDIDGIRIGFINLCEAHPFFFRNKNQDFGYAWIGDPMISNRIERLKSKTDKIIAFVHGGLEHSTCPLLYFRYYYRMLCDIGVDAVIGSHPHIPQGIEKYNEKLICYSLGNFYFPRTIEANDTDIENHSYSLVLDISQEKIEYSVIYHKMNNLVVEIEDKESSPVDVDKLSELLAPDIYKEKHALIIKNTYEGLVSNLYRNSLNTISSNDNFKEKIKRTIAYWLLNSRMTRNSANKHKTLVHLLNNETYRFIVNEYYKNDYEGEHK